MNISTCIRNSTAKLASWKSDSFSSIETNLLNTPVTIEAVAMSGILHQNIVTIGILKLDRSIRWSCAADHKVSLTQKGILILTRTSDSEITLLLGYTLPLSSNYTEEVMFGSVGRLFEGRDMVVSVVGLFVVVGIPAVTVVVVST